MIVGFWDWGSGLEKAYAVSPASTINPRGPKHYCLGLRFRVGKLVRLGVYMFSRSRTWRERGMYSASWGLAFGDPTLGGSGSTVSVDSRKSLRSLGLGPQDLA